MIAPSGADLVATLIAVKGEKLSPDFLQKLAAQVEAARTEFINDGVADVFCAGMTAESLRQRLGDFLAGKKIDILIQPVANRLKKLLIADMESTIIEQEMLDELADVIGMHDKVADITRRAMNGELDFAQALRERVALLKGQPASILEDVAKRITFMPGAVELVAAMKKQGAACWLVSGGFTCFAEPVAAKLGFDECFTNELLVKDGILTGEVAEPILDKNSKKQLLEKACDGLGLSLSNTLTIGDGANDIPMLQTCHDGGGLGVAYHAKLNVRAAIPNQINHGDLTALVYAQGFID